MECRSSLCVGRATTSNLSDQPQFLTPPPTVNNPPTNQPDRRRRAASPFSNPNLGRSCGSRGRGGEIIMARGEWGKCRKKCKKYLEIAGGACGGVELCLDGKDLSALVVSHTFHSFLIFQRGESTCRGTGPIFLARPLFTGGLDQFYFYQPQHPCVAHHSCCSLLSTKSVQHSNLELFSPPLLFIHHLIHHRFQTCLTHLTQLSPHA